MTALPDWDAVSDAELARAAAAGDRGAFARIYDRYADRLYDFCAGILRDRDAAADCVQDAFCHAATGLGQLREPDKLRPWLYSIARHKALATIRERRREQASDELPEVASNDPGPETLATRSELAALVAEAAGGLSERDRSVLELAYRHGLDGSELAEALGISYENAKKTSQRLRQTIERSLGALLIARRARSAADGCPELHATLAGWNGQFTILMRKRIVRHMESCATCDEERRQMVSPVALLGGVPVFIPAPGWLRERTLDRAQLARAGGGPAADETEGETADQDHLEADGGGRGRRLLVVGALLIAALITAFGLTIAWLHERSVPISPTDLTRTTNQPTNTAPAGPLIAGTTPPSPAPTTASPGIATSAAPTSQPGPAQPPAQPPAGTATQPVITVPPTQIGRPAPLPVVTGTPGGPVTTAPIHLPTSPPVGTTPPIHPVTPHPPKPPAPVTTTTNPPVIQ